MDTPTTYTIEVDQGQAQGWVSYIEHGQKLTFAWEALNIPGRKVIVPAASTWSTFCEQHGASWAKNSREEIVQRLGDGLAEQWYQGGSHNRVEDGDWEWLCVYPPPSGVEKFLDGVFVWADLLK